MRERREIVRRWREGGMSVLVTLVEAEGSSYRRPGARLLLSGRGDYAGTISGGCLESEVVRKAGWMVRAGAVVERYSTMFDDTADVPFGLGCGGVVDLLLEPVATPECGALMTALERSLEGVRSTVCTWLPGERRGLARTVLSASGEVVFGSEGLSAREREGARGLAREQTAAGTFSEGVFIESLEPPQRLFVLGAGDDAKPLVSMAALLGWSVVVMEGRAQLARAERFPEAERVAAIVNLDTAALQIGEDDAVVLMTHSYEQDRDLLAAVLPLKPRYFGLLGARHRSSLLVSEAAAMLGWSVAKCCERIYAPVGLDLGGDGPEAIALAVIAEAHACCMGKLGTSRRLSEQDVARHVKQGGSERYLQAQCALDAV